MRRELVVAAIVGNDYDDVGLPGAAANDGEESPLSADWTPWANAKSVTSIPAMKKLFVFIVIPPIKD